MQNEEESSCWLELFSTVEEFEENLAKKGKQILIKHLGNQEINTL